MTWNKKFELLCPFHHENWHCHVPTNFEVESVRLCNWLHSQRIFYKMFMEVNGRASITQERIGLLNGIGFQWSLKAKQRLNGVINSLPTVFVVASNVCKCTVALCFIRNSAASTRRDALFRDARLNCEKTPIA